MKATFGIALHVMLTLAYQQGKRINSAQLSASIGVNPVMVRRVIRQLAAASLIRTRIGREGGSMLAKPARRITIADILEAVETGSRSCNHGHVPCGSCPISLHMPQVFSKVDSLARAGMLENLRKLKLNQLMP